MAGSFTGFCVNLLAPSRISIATTTEDRWRNAMSYENLCLLKKSYRCLFISTQPQLTRPT